MFSIYSVEKTLRKKKRITHFFLLWDCRFSLLTSLLVRPGIVYVSSDRVFVRFTALPVDMQTLNSDWLNSQTLSAFFQYLLVIIFKRSIVKGMSEWIKPRESKLLISDFVLGNTARGSVETTIFPKRLYLWWSVVERLWRRTKSSRRLRVQVRSDH